MKKYLFVLFSLVLAFVSLSSIGPANKGNAIEVNLEQEPGKVIVPFDITVINNVRHQGTSAFEDDFTLTEENGDKLNVYVKNNHGTGTVKLKVFKHDTDQEWGYYEIGPGDHLTKSFTMTDGGGMRGDWEVYVTTDDGHSMDINVNARQF